MTVMEHTKFSLSDPSLFASQGLIAGSWKSPQSGKSFPVIDPSTGGVLGQCADFEYQDFVDAVECAHDGYQTFSSSTTAKERGAMLRRWNDLILANLEDCKESLRDFAEFKADCSTVATILSLENGKTLAEAKGEINYSASFVSWFAEEAARSYGDTIPRRITIPLS
ncbi:uncharacterized protein PAC_03565 [Phialocephala subalpina]|uniref:Aldehyde dehydrogenase domain-containing protein n=1 Tax=Phialocephala subalpina TaxID=576137 RepID=A0A1L7WLP4_9HELO|nr:uncharacterized protein PAC_03565 [Phialocephala subalpina]